MAQQRQCFYCKQTFQSSHFHTHLKQCPQRQKKNNPGPLQQAPPQYNQYNRGMQQPQYAPQQNRYNMGGGGGGGGNPQQGRMQQPQQYGGGGGGFNRMGGGLPPPNQMMPPPQQQAQPQAQQQSAPSSSSAKQDQYWECQSCTFVNSTSSGTCRICSNPQPNSGGGGGGGGGNAAPNNNRPNPPPPPQQQQQQPMYSDPAPPIANHNNNDNNEAKLQFGGNNGAPPQQAPQQPEAMDYSGFGGGGGGGPQEPDDATAALIAQMLAAEKCVVCSKNQGFQLSCGDNVCAPCGKKYILNGIATGKWKKEALTCPSSAPSNNCKGILPLWIVKECGLGAGMQSKLEEMQNKYMIDSDPTITSCPKCKETYSTEVGDMNAVSEKEKGPDGKLLSLAHRQHKAKYRFRCSGGGCRTVFCSGCYATPYHTGYTCAEYKRYRESKKCRFCEVSLDATNTAQKDATLKAGLDCVCSGAECLEKRRWSCDLVHDCGHACIGLMGHECIPCLNEKCLSKKAAVELTDDEYCNICWVDPLRAAPCVKLTCKHYFHFMCLWQKIDRKWPAARITFGFLNCPLCKKEIHHPALDDITKKYYDLKAEIQKDAIERVKIEGLANDKRMKDSNSPYFNNLPKYALDRLAFYPCSKCKKPYFGGMKACEEAGLEQAENYKQEHLVCGSCASGPNAKSCKKHGKKYITYKCKFCCSVSSWYCWGSTHFCDKCHKKQEQGDYLNRKQISELPKCPGVDLCPLGIEHPANGVSEFSLGCVVCLRK